MTNYFDVLLDIVSEVQYFSRYLFSATMGLLPFQFWYPIYRSLQWKFGGLSRWDVHRHLDRFECALEKAPDLSRLNEYDFFEIGTGGSLFHPLLAFVIGFRSVYTCDRVDIRDPRLIAISINFILDNQQIIEQQLSRSTGTSIHLDISRVQTLASIDFYSIIECLPITFHQTNTSESSIAFFRQVKLSSKAFLFSSDVLEHVESNALNQFELLLDEPRPERLTMYHFIDLSDHFATRSISKHRFRSFPEWIWKIVGLNKYHYCNRISKRDFLTLFSPHGLFATRSDDHLGKLEVWCDSQRSLNGW